MKQRITYALPRDTVVDALDIAVGDDHLNYTKTTHAAEEWKLTLGKTDVPDELQIVLENCHELHIRWAAPSNGNLPNPFVSRIPSGLHVFFTPRTPAEKSALCGLIQTLSGLRGSKCHSVERSFTRPRPLSERFASSASYQYFQYSPLSTRIGRIFFRKICNTVSADGPALDNCNAQIEEMSQASHIDIDFDAITQTLTLNVLWEVPIISRNTLVARRARPIRKLRNEDRVEVGILHREGSNEPEEMSFGGFLTIIGDDDDAKPTVFSFPSRHHPMPSSTQLTYNASFQQPTGLHPKLEIALSRQLLLPPKNTCNLHAYMTLPSALFIDRYQLSDQLFLDSQNLVALRNLSGEDDLEAPDWTIERWGSVALFELATPRSHDSSTAAKDTWTVTIPTHLRYIQGPNQEDDNTSEATVTVPWPVVFWACDAEEGLKMATNPFDRVNLGYDGLFGPKTLFYHVPPVADAKELVNDIHVPVLNAQQAASVQMGTLIAVTAGFAWVCWQLVKSTGRWSRRNSHVKSE